MSEEWREQYVCRCEAGFWDQDGHGEITIPKGMQVYWLDDPASESVLNRPEMDAKDKQAGQPEVFEGRFSATGFFLHSTGTFWLVTDPIYVQNGRPVRGELMYMHVFNNGNGGARAGLTDGDGWFRGDRARKPAELSPIEACATWGAWLGTYGAERLPNRKWAQLTTPEVVPSQGHVRLAVQFNLDNPGFGAGHFDVFRVEQYLEGTVPVPGQAFDWDRMRQLVREELDKTRLSG